MQVADDKVRAAVGLLGVACASSVALGHEVRSDLRCSRCGLVVRAVWDGSALTAVYERDGVETARQPECVGGLRKRLEVLRG